MRVVRVYQQQHASTAFTGDGARLHGGRWNSKGVPMVYTAATLSLALLEIIVNAGVGTPPDYVYATIDIPEELVRAFPAADLPADWQTYPAPQSLSTIGDAWVASADSLALVVPSVVVPIESNVLLNPAHQEFRAIIISEPAPLPIDARLPIARA